MRYVYRRVFVATVVIATIAAAGRSSAQPPQTPVIHSTFELVMSKYRAQLDDEITRAVLGIPTLDGAAQNFVNVLGSMPLPRNYQPPSKGASPASDPSPNPQIDELIRR